jgi:hypothetical protein
MNLPVGTKEYKVYSEYYDEKQVIATSTQEAATIFQGVTDNSHHHTFIFVELSRTEEETTVVEKLGLFEWMTTYKKVTLCSGTREVFESKEYLTSEGLLDALESRGTEEFSYTRRV